MSGLVLKSSSSKAHVSFVLRTFQIKNCARKRTKQETYSLPTRQFSSVSVLADIARPSGTVSNEVRESTMERSQLTSSSYCKAVTIRATNNMCQALAAEETIYSPEQALRGRALDAMYVDVRHPINTGLHVDNPLCQRYALASGEVFN